MLQERAINTSEYKKELDIKISASMVVDEVLLSNFSKLVDYRKHIAREIINCHDDVTREQLMMIYEHSQWHLKRLLGL